MMSKRGAKSSPNWENISNMVNWENQQFTQFGNYVCLPKRERAGTAYWVNAFFPIVEAVVEASEVIEDVSQAVSSKSDNLVLASLGSTSSSASACNSDLTA